jgi:prepilin-type N-terminal cleavage/methylation domain-containing protein
MRHGPASGKGFTLLELLVVVAIIAVVGAGVSVFYGKEHTARSKRQMTLHEMGQIRQAFRQFYADNEALLLRELTTPEGATLPTAAFRNSFDAGPDSGSRLYGALEFFERFGLWPLMQPAVAGLATNDFTVFRSADILTGEGWRGPYLNVPSRTACVPDDADGDGLDELVTAGPADAPVFPQMASRYGGIYRVLYFEHCEDEGDPSEPVYRRLLLVCAEDDLTFDSSAELLPFTGNRRGGGGAGPAPYPLDLATGSAERHDEARGLFFAELLNLDTWRNN